MTAHNGHHAIGLMTEREPALHTADALLLASYDEMLTVFQLVYARTGHLSIKAIVERAVIARCGKQ